MTIVCGTDLSPRSAQVASLAARLAARLDQPLVLVHTLDTRGAVFNVAGVLDAVERASRGQLEAETRRLQALGAVVEPHVTDGWPDEGILQSAHDRRADLIVLSAVGQRAGGGVRLGRTCERVALRAEAPVLVVRETEPLDAWLRGERELRILSAFDFSEASEAALAWSRRLEEVGRCHVVAAYVDDPVQEVRRLGLRQPAGDAASEAQHIVEYELRDRLARVFGTDRVPVVVAPHLGDPALRLAELAAREQADLVLVGTHQRRGADRVLHGSVSMDLIRKATVSVLEVPIVAAPAALPPGPPQRVLIATDLSPLGNQAVRRAFAILAHGSRVHLLTAVHPLRLPTAPLARPIDDPAARAEFDAWKAQCRHELDSLVPVDAAARGISVEADVVEHADPALAIREAAERIDAELICMGTTGRTGLKAALLGSVAQSVLGHCRRPVLLLPAQP